MAIQNNAGAEKYRAEQGEQRVAQQWDAVMGSDAARGREALARTLLSLHGANEMTSDRIIATLEKAPLPSPAQETTQQQAVDSLANFGPVATPGSIFDNQLYEAGATYTRMLLGKKE